jgi:hypothetical protein
MTTLICFKTTRWKSRALFEIKFYTILTHVLFFLGGFTIWRKTETAQSVAPPIDDSMAIAASKGPTEGLHGGTMANRGNHGFPIP